MDFENMKLEELEFMLPMAVCMSDGETERRYTQVLDRSECVIKGVRVRFYRAFYRERNGKRKAYETGPYVSLRDTLERLAEKLARDGVIRERLRAPEAAGRWVDDGRH